MKLMAMVIKGYPVTGLSQRNQSMGGSVVKARLVARGFEEEIHSLRKDSHTISNYNYSLNLLKHGRSSVSKYRFSCRCVNPP